MFMNIMMCSGTQYMHTLHQRLLVMAATYHDVNSFSGKRTRDSPFINKYSISQY